MINPFRVLDWFPNPHFRESISTQPSIQPTANGPLAIRPGYSTVVQHGLRGVLSPASHSSPVGPYLERVCCLPCCLDCPTTSSSFHLFGVHSSTPTANMSLRRLIKKLEVPHDGGTVPSRWVNNDIRPIEKERRTWNFWAFHNLCKHPPFSSPLIL